VVILTAIANGLIAVIGTAIAIVKAPWLALATTGLAAAIGALMAWDEHFRHRDLWTQRTVILGRLQALQRTTEFRRSAGEQRDLIARDCLQELNRVLDDDLTTWIGMRRSHPPEQRATTESGDAISAAAPP
jgi:hypothetical protein